MRKSVKIAIATAFAGLVAAGGAAFTATGLVDNSAGDQFIGGTVSQSVTGATLDNVTYGFADVLTHNKVNSIKLTFSADAEGKTVTLGINGATQLDFLPADGATVTEGQVTFTDTNGVDLSTLAVTVDSDQVTSN